MFDLIDRIVGLDIGGRGVTGLYAPARAMTTEPICAAAARTLCALKPGDRVFILTGSLSRAGVSTDIAENDGPIGAAVLARALTYGFNAIPVVLVDETIADKTAAMIERAGPNVLTQSQADTTLHERHRRRGRTHRRQRGADARHRSGGTPQSQGSDFRRTGGHKRGRHVSQHAGAGLQRRPGAARLCH